MSALDSKEMEERLLQIMTAVESSSNAIGISDVQGRHFYQNKAYTELFGYATAEELQAAGGGAATVWDPAVAKELFDTILAGRTWSGELKLVTKSGRVFDAFERADAIKDKNGRLVGLIGLVTDISERKRAEEALQASEARLRAIVETEPECVKMVARDGQLLEMNPAGLGMIEADRPEQVLGQCIYGLVVPEHRDAFRALTENACRGQAGTLEFEVVGLKGAHRWLETHAVPFRRRPADEPCLLAITRDITQRKQAEAELHKHREHLEELVAVRTAELQAANSDLEAFSYSVSHDLRAPLRAIQGYVEICLRQRGAQLGPAGSQMLEMALGSAQWMDRLIQDVLAFTRMSRQEIQIQDVAVEKLLREIIRERPEFQPPRAEIEIEGPLLPMRGNEVFLTQCITNLLGNAVKFVASGVEPRVRIFSQAAGGRVRLWIADNGIGIPKETQEKLFTMCQRGQGSQGYEGTGLGLAIVRKAVERMGGRAGLESEPGRGSRFWVELPRAE